MKRRSFFQKKIRPVYIKKKTPAIDNWNMLKEYYFKRVTDTRTISTPKVPRDILRQMIWIENHYEKEVWWDHMKSDYYKMVVDRNSPTFRAIGNSVVRTMLKVEHGSKI